MNIQKMNKTLLAAIIGVVSIQLTACSTTGGESTLSNAFSSSEVAKTTQTTYKATRAEDVALFYDNEKPSQRYKVIGRVNANAHNFMAIPISEEKIKRAIQEKAASIGGNAVIAIHRDLDTETGSVVRYIK